MPIEMPRVVGNRTNLEAATPPSLRRSFAGGHGHRARLSAIALATGMCRVSCAAVAGDYYTRGGTGLGLDESVEMGRV